MRMEFLDGTSAARAFGGAVVRSNLAGVTIEFGSADGPPVARLRLSHGEAGRLCAALKAVADGRDEEIILAEE